MQNTMVVGGRGVEWECRSRKHEQRGKEKGENCIKKWVKCLKIASF